MDSKEYRNQQIERNRITNTPVIVKKIKLIDNTDVLYVVIASNIEDIKEMRESDTINPYILDTLKSNNIITTQEEIKAVLVSGNLIKFKGYSNYVYRFPYRTRDIKEGKDPHYREYTRTLAQQKEIMWLINICNSAEKSWKSVLTKIGSSYGLLLKIQRQTPKS